MKNKIKTVTEKSGKERERIRENKTNNDDREWKKV